MSGRDAIPGRVGVWTAALDALAPGAAQETAAELEELGYASLWIAESFGREAFTHAAFLLAATESMTIATGIASIYARDAMATAGASRTLNAQHPGRFVLGLGVSHAPLVEGLRGHAYGKPVTSMRAYLDALDQAPYQAGGGPEAEPAPPCVLGALGPRMIELAGERAAGAHTYAVTVKHTADSRERLGADAILAVEQKVAVTADRTEGLRRARAHLEIYLGLPNYRASWLRQGFTEDDFEDGGSEHLVDALVAIGEEDVVAARVRDQLEAGASHVCLQALGEDGAQFAREDHRRLAPLARELV